VDLGSPDLAVTVADGRSVVVEIAHDARVRESVQLSFGRVLIPTGWPPTRLLRCLAV
jgi:hypothetical protein